MFLTLLQSNTGVQNATIVWRKDGAAWKRTLTFVKVTSTWKESKAFVKVSGIWK